ncbi:MAG TPA: AAA family ATPase [Variovorax sp.]
MSACPNCGAPRQARHRFCWSCGALLNAHRELKQATVLLADLCDSTTRVVQTDAEGGQAFLDRAYRMMSAAVAAYGGTQVQWRGDELLALFGAPIAQEDHALRACMAAVAMLEGMKAQQPGQAPMIVSIGIDSGEVIVGPGSGDLATSYRVDGAPVHLASRLEQLAPPGAAYVSGSTMQLVGGQIEARSLGKRLIRSFEIPVEVHEIAAGLQGSAAAPLARRRYLSPLVGRDESMDLLMAAAAGVRSRRLFRAVGLCGDAGIGKSRLIAELCLRLQAQGFATVSVAAHAYGSRAPYNLVADIVRSLPGPADEDAGDALSRREPDGDAEDEEVDAAALTDLLATGDPGDRWRALTPPQRRDRIASAFIRRVRESAGQAPLVLAVEDVFLADRRSVRLLESLAKRLQGHPLLLVMSYRPDFAHRWNEAPWFDEHRIGPLASGEITALADSLLGGDASLTEIRRALLERAGGNPLFLEQMVMTLVDGGGLLGPPGAYRSVPSEVPLRVPASIMAIIGARVDRLPPGAKASLEAAALLGEPLEAAVVAAMRDIPEAEAERHLRHALSGGLIVAAPAERHYSFRHGLVQDSVLAALTRSRRSQLHRAAFEALSARVGAQATANAATLAHHAFHGEQWRAAAEQALAAMSRSIARSENKDALRQFEFGLDAARRLDAQAAMPELALRVEALGAQMALGLFDAIVSNLERAESITKTLGDVRRQAAVSLQLAVTLWARGSYSQGLAVATDAGKAAASAGSRSLQMAAMQARLMLHHGLGRYEEAGADAAQLESQFGAELRARRLMPGWAVIASVNRHAFKAHTLLLRGDLGAAQAACNDGYQELQEQDHPFSRVLLDFVQGDLLMAQQRSGEAVALLSASLELCRVHELANMYPAILAHLGGALALDGQAAQALALLEPAIAQKASMAGGRYNDYYFPYFFALALHAGGREDEAVVSARQACDVASSFEQRGHETRALLLLARLEAMAGRSQDAAEHLAEAKALAQQCRMDGLLRDIEDEPAGHAAPAPSAATMPDPNHA